MSADRAGPAEHRVDDAAKLERGATQITPSTDEARDVRGAESLDQLETSTTPRDQPTGHGCAPRWRKSS